MLNIKKGDVLKCQDDNEKVKILAIVDGLYAISDYDRYESFGSWCTEKDLRNEFILSEEKWEPKDGDILYSVAVSSLGVYEYKWENSTHDIKLLEAGLLKRTRAEAQAKLDEILAVLKK